MAALAAALVILPFSFPLMRPALTHPVASRVTQLTNLPWLLAPAAHAPTRSAKKVPGADVWLSTPVSVPSMTTVASVFEFGNGSSESGTPSSSLSIAGR